MTVEEIQALYPQAEQTAGGSLRMTTTIASQEARVTFRFTQRRLAAVNVVLLPASNIRAQHFIFQDLLTEKYGTPFEARDTAREAQERVGSYRAAARVSAAGDEIGRAISGAAPSESGLRHQANLEADAERAEVIAEQRAREAQGNFGLSSRWSSEETIVTLEGRQSPESTKAAIYYVSKLLGPQLKAELEHAREARRREMAKDL